MFPARHGKVGHHHEGVPAPGGPAGDGGNDRFGSGAHEPLYLEDVQPAELALLDAFLTCRGGQVVVGGTLRRLVLVASRPPNALVATRAERVPAVLGGGAVGGEDDGSHVGRTPCDVQATVELVNGVRTEGIAQAGSVEGDPHDGQVLTCRCAIDLPTRDETVKGHVGQVDVHLTPPIGGKGVGDEGQATHPREVTTAVAPTKGSRCHTLFPSVFHRRHRHFIGRGWGTSWSPLVAPDGGAAARRRRHRRWHHPCGPATTPRTCRGALPTTPIRTPGRPSPR